MYPTQISIAPWLEINEPIQFASVEFLPKEEALRRWPEAAANIDDVTSYFCTGYMYPNDEYKTRYLNGERVPMQPEMTKATIVDCSADSDKYRVESAFDALAFASMSQSNEGSTGYSNAPVFRRDFMTLAEGSASVAHRTRSRSGVHINVFGVRSRIESKPAYCGTFVSPDPEMLDALAIGVYAADSERLRNGLRVLSQATYDSSHVPPEIEASFYALVAARLLADPTSPDDKIGPRLKRAHIFLDAVAPNGAEEIIGALRATNRRRNGVWHAGQTLSADKDPYEEHPLVPFALVAFRAIEAVVIAELVALGALSVHSKTALIVQAIEEWIAGLGSITIGIPTDPFERREAANKAMDLGGIWRKKHMAEVIRRFADGGAELSPMGP